MTPKIFKVSCGRMGVMEVGSAEPGLILFTCRGAWGSMLSACSNNFMRAVVLLAPIAWVARVR